jgi:ribonuclease HI
MFMAREDRKPKPSILHIYVDGAAEPTNPGPSASAWIIMDPTYGEVLVEKTEFLGRQTNNVAEYMAIIRGMDECMAYCRGKVRVHSDSQLCVNQINGNWRVKTTHLRPLLDEVYRLKDYFKEVQFVWVPRENEWISRCDRNAADVLETRQGGREGP